MDYLSGDMDRFEEWKELIKEYCIANGLNFDKASEMVKCSNKNMLILQYYEPGSGEMGLLDETPMPAVLMVFRDGEGVRIEQTEFTKQYLGE